MINKEPRERKEITDKKSLLNFLQQHPLSSSKIKSNPEEEVYLLVVKTVKKQGKYDHEIISAGLHPERNKILSKILVLCEELYDMHYKEGETAVLELIADNNYEY